MLKKMLFTGSTRCQCTSAGACHMASDSGRFRHISSMRATWKSLLATISGVSGSSSR
jgi:hypothetical protein